MEKSEKMEVYEIGYHIVPSVSEENLATEVGKIMDLIKGAEIISEEAPKLTDLAYTIAKQVGGLRRKFDKAYFGWVKFEMDNKDIAAVKKSLDANENVLRFLLIKTVRENTLYGSKLVAAEEVAKKKATVKKEEKAPASQEEIDKSIDELIKE